MPTRRTLLAALAALTSPVTLALPAFARPMRYALAPDAARVGFIYVVSGGEQTGQMPITRADVIIDPVDMSASTVDVVLNPAGVRTGFFFATEALKSQSMLDTNQFPDIRFTSTEVQLSPSGRLSDGATLIGDLTVRDVTRTVTLEAALFRPRGTAPDDLSVLTIMLKGAISRSAFGASGYGDLVDDTVRLDIEATIRAMG